METGDLAELALELGLSFEEGQKAMCGRQKGYTFYLMPLEDDGQYGIFFSVRGRDGYVDSQLLEGLLEQSEVLSDFERAGYCVAYRLVPLLVGEELPALLEAAIEDSTRYFEYRGLTDCCEKTGRTGLVSLYEVEDELLFLTPESYEELQAAAVEKADKKRRRSEKENYLFGFVGALLGSLLGGTGVFFLTSSLRVTSFFSVLTGLLIMFFYAMLAGKFSLVSIGLAFFLAPAANLLGYQLRYAQLWVGGEGVGMLTAFHRFNQLVLTGQSPENYWFYAAVIFLASIASSLYAVRNRAQFL